MINKKIKIFVTDAEEGRIPLSIIRSLGPKNIKLYVGGDMKFATPYFSRYCTKKVVYPSIKDEPEKFKEFMFKFIEKNKFDVVIPVMNEAVMFFSKYKEELSKFTIIPFADYGKLMLAMDKSKTLKIAEKLGIPQPKTFYPESIYELRLIKDQLTYPVILKPRKGFGSIGLKRCYSWKCLMRDFRIVSMDHGSPLVQEFIPAGGDAIGVSCLYGYDNKSRAMFTHKRLRQYPIKGGPSTLRESIQNQVAEEMAIKLLDKLNWFGVAMVEFRVDPRDNIPKLMEINPRFWGSLSLPIFAGVDFPYLLYKLVTEGDIEKVSGYKVGVRSRWVGGDFLYLLHTKNKIKFLKEFMKFRQKDTLCEDFVIDDPVPPLSRVLTALYVLDKKVRKKVFRNY
jgi:predicted ATP-grasp superfamily ATP-dependent carboligase